MRKLVLAVAIAGVGLFSASAMAQVPITLCNFGGTSFFTPNLKGSPGSNIAFTFRGSLQGCSGPNAAALNGTTVSTSNGVITSGSCAESQYKVPSFQACKDSTKTPGTFFCDSDTSATICCTGTVGTGIAAAGLATALPTTVSCNACGITGNHTADYLLQFLTTGGTGVLSACGPTGAGVDHLTFTGEFGSN